LGLAIGDAFGPAKRKRIEFYTKLVRFASEAVKAHQKDLRALSSLMTGTVIATLKVLANSFAIVSGVIDTLKSGFFSLVQGILIGAKGAAQGINWVRKALGATDDELVNIEALTFAIEEFDESSNKAAENAIKAFSFTSKAAEEGVNRQIAAEKRLETAKRNARKAVAEIPKGIGTPLPGGGDGKKKKEVLIGPTIPDAFLAQAKLQAEERKRIAEDATAFEEMQIDNTNKMRDESLQREADRLKERKSMQADGMRSFVSNLGTIANANKKFGTIFKAAAIAETTVSTIAAAQNQFKAGSQFPYPANLVMPWVLSAAAIGAGFARVAAIKAQKFAGGGVVQGQRSGDRIPILANGGELMSNQAQQKRLLDLIEGRAGGGRSSITFGDININSSGGDADEIASAVNRTRQEQIRAAQNLLNEKGALLVT